ncbi:MAG TPA: DUF5937 family protein, partial [Gemmatimonadaceae bacterium]|nr:DUF5937 family protein [Gemmatimonadaceae bacterium]
SRLERWRREIDRRLPARLRTNLAAAAPSPLIWPLLADALRDAPPEITFAELVEALRTLDDAEFQRSVLGGVFKGEGNVDGLMSGKVSLGRTIAGEAQRGDRLLALLGLHPFHRRSGPAKTFGRIVSAPGEYRDEIVSLLESFWAAGFSDTWAKLEPQMRETADTMQARIARRDFSSLADEYNLPVTLEGESLVTARGGSRYPLGSVSAFHLIPSAFNTAKLWASYEDSHRENRFFVPVLDAALSPDTEPRIVPAAVFRALGDTTRYALASILARTPTTSVELARALDVSKPTISHHVQQLRMAGLLEENQADGGIVLSLNRYVLENVSEAASREMFSEEGPPPQVRRTRRANKT